MKSYLNKALLYKEWKNMMPLSFLFLMEIYLLIIMPFINVVQRLQEKRYDEYYLHFFTNVLVKPRFDEVLLVGTVIIIGTFAIGI
jgi:hypothetical protein